MGLKSNFPGFHSETTSTTQVSWFFKQLLPFYHCVTFYNCRVTFQFWYLGTDCLCLHCSMFAHSSCCLRTQLCPKCGTGVCHVFACSVVLQTFRDKFTRVMTSYKPGFLHFLLRESGHLRSIKKQLDPDTVQMWVHPHPGMRIQTWKASVNGTNTGKGQTQSFHLTPTCPEESLTNMKIRGLDK